MQCKKYYGPLNLPPRIHYAILNELDLRRSVGFPECYTKKEALGVIADWMNHRREWPRGANFGKVSQRIAVDAFISAGGKIGAK